MDTHLEVSSQPFSYLDRRFSGCSRGEMQSLILFKLTCVGCQTSVMSQDANSGMNVRGVVIQFLIGAGSVRWLAVLSGHRSYG